MIKCKGCGTVSEYLGTVCPKCKEKYSLCAAELENIEKDTEAAFALRDFDRASEGLRILCDFGSVAAIKKYASMLENGQLVKRDAKSAAYYYLLGARLGDAHCALNYSRLVRRESERLFYFWLCYSALLGYTDAYLPLAEALLARSERDAALYYFSLAEESGSKSAAARLAILYAEDESTLAYSKWYLDKFTVPPLRALRLAYTLRNTEPVEPQMPEHPDFRAFVYSLVHTAKEIGADTAYFGLCEILSDIGEISMQCALALCLANGVGTARDGERAIALLTDAKERGSAAASRSLGDIYKEGKIVEADPSRALEYYLWAAEAGDGECYEIMGETYLRGESVERSVPEAIRLFDLAAREGVASAREKSDELKEKRRALFDNAGTAASDEDAFRLYCISAGMGYIPAYRELATLFLLGRGTRRDRGRAFYWYKRAVDEGDYDALYPLALCYSRGIGTAFDFNMARRTLLAAASRGVAEAKEELVRILENKKRRLARKTYSRAMGQIHKRKFAEAKESLEACVVLSHPKGIYTLGCLCEFGIGIEANRERAFSLYEEAFALRFRDPRATYKLSVLKMSREALR